MRPTKLIGYILLQARSDQVKLGLWLGKRNQQGVNNSEAVSKIESLDTKSILCNKGKFSGSFGSQSAQKSMVKYNMYKWGALTQENPPV